MLQHLGSLVSPLQGSPCDVVLALAGVPIRAERLTHDGVQRRERRTIERVQRVHGGRVRELLVLVRVDHTTSDIVRAGHLSGTAIAVQEHLVGVVLSAVPLDLKQVFAVLDGKTWYELAEIDRSVDIVHPGIEVAAFGGNAAPASVIGVCERLLVLVILVNWTKSSSLESLSHRDGGLVEHSNVALEPSSGIQVIERLLFRLRRHVGRHLGDARDNLGSGHRWVEYADSYDNRNGCSDTDTQTLEPVRDRGLHRSPSRNC
jgi:hypothetical protein